MVLTLASSKLNPVKLYIVDFLAAIVCRGHCQCRALAAGADAQERVVTNFLEAGATVAGSSSTCR